MNPRAAQASPRTDASGPEAPAGSGSPGSDLLAPHAVPLVIAGRYRVRRLLKEGNGIATYLATDEFGQDGGAALVVVKTTPMGSLSTTAWLRLHHEAAVVSALHPPGAGGRVTVGRDDDIAFVVQPFVDGIPLDHRLEQSGEPMPVADALLIARELFGTLERVHEQGVLHRDIKPANVIIDPNSPPAWAVLIDFGLARSSRLPESIRDLPVGTARFISPEQAGLIEADVDERADLYSAGILLFTCLAGRPPFDGEEAGELLRAQVSSPVPTLASVGITVPAAVEALVQRLLRKDPVERYQSAAAVVADVDEIAEGLAAGDDDPQVLIGLHDHRRTLTEPVFVGRTVELGALAAQLEEAANGHGGLVVVEAESGGGKTRILEELARRADQRSFWILRGQGLDQTGQRPFQMLEGVAAAVLEATCDPHVQRRIRERVGEQAESIVAALPELATVLGQAAGKLGPETYGEARSLQALPTLFEALGSPERPAVVIFDDCQWADTLTAKLLARWQAVASRSSFVNVVVAYRTEEVDQGHPLRALRPALHVHLAPLDASEIGGLVQSMAGPLPRAAIETVTRLSEGSPFMAAAVLRGMVECGALVGSRDGWELDAIALRGVQASRRAGAFLLRRMDLLSPRALALLTVGAVIGKDFDLGLGVALAGQDAGAAVPALAEARARRILWVAEDGGRCFFFHDKLRDALLARLSPAERAALHLQAAERIEADDPSQDPGRVFELAYHFDAAGAPERALPYALAAAQQARSQYALELSEAQYRIAARAAESGTDDARRIAAEGLGEVLSLRGSYPEALEQLRAARALATTRTTRAQLDWRIGEVGFRCGNVNDALTDLEGALEGLGRRPPASRVLLLVALLWEVMVQAAHTLAPRFFLARRSGPMPEEESLAARIYSRLAYVHWFRSGRIPCAWAHLRELNMAERYDAGPELAQAYSEHAPVMTMAPWFSRGIEYAERSLEIRTRLEDRWGQGQSLSFNGVVLYAASDYPGCIDRFRKAIRLLDRTGDRWEANTAAWHIAMAHYRLGELSRAHELAEQTYQRAEEIGDQAAMGIALSVWSRATGGRVPAALVAAELAKHTDDAHTATELLLAEGVRRLQVGKPAEATTTFQQAAAVVKAAGLRQEYVAPVQPWLATALRRQAEACDAFHLGERRRLLRKARRTARTAVRTARHYRNNLPHALRELALIEAMLGHPDRALAPINESLAVAGEQSARFEHAESLAAKGRMGTAAGWPGAVEDSLTGEAALELLLQPVAGDEIPTGDEGTLSLVDRFAGLLEAARTIAAAPSLVAVHEAARAAAERLLRGEACHFLELTGDALHDGQALFMAGAGGGATGVEAPPEVSRSLVRQSVAIGRPVTDRLNGSAQESLELAGIRSAICAPILLDGRVVECLYVTHGQVGGLFGPEEERLASFIATLAGATLEHLAGSEARFRSLVEHSSDVITVVDAHGTIQYQSSSMDRVFGLARLRHADGTWRPVEITFSNLLHDPVVRGIVLNIRDLTELRWQETHDSLTGLPNRALFTDRATEALDKARRGLAAPAVIYADLDDFKEVNDRLGHRGADAVLAAIGKRLRGCVGPNDTVARFGGDEFAILLADAADGVPQAVATDLLGRVAAPLVFANQEVRVQASVGIARPAQGHSVGDLLAAADLAMYGAKAQARGSFRVFEHRMRSAAVERSTLKAELSGAVEREEFVLHYQPIVEMATGQVVGLEPLLRWRHPRRGLLVPSDFMAIAEDSNQIFELGAWVLHEACTQAVQLPPEWGGPGQGHVSVNVSGRQVEDPRLTDAVSEALASSGLDPWRLVLEITETVMVRDFDAIVHRLTELKALGVRLAVDDFGTGYSSLRYLHQLPVDMIKIDKTFVESLCDSAEVELLAETIVRLGRTLGLTTVAEGVETAAQAERLAALGCEMAQGYYYSYPVDLPGLVSLLAAA